MRFTSVYRVKNRNIDIFTSVYRVYFTLRIIIYTRFAEVSDPVFAYTKFFTYLNGVSHLLNRFTTRHLSFWQPNTFYRGFFLGISCKNSYLYYSLIEQFSPCYSKAFFLGKSCKFKSYFRVGVNRYFVWNNLGKSCKPLKY